VRPPRVAILHDWLTTFGGAERCVVLFHKLFPAAPIYTLVCDHANLPEELKSTRIITSFIQKLPDAARKYPNYLPLMPRAVEQWDLSGYDLVLSSCHCCIKGVITREDQAHVCYLYTPIRYIWDLYHIYLQHTKMSGIRRKVFEWTSHYLRMWDFCAAQRVDKFIAISETVRRRIEKTYQRKSGVIYPPVNTDFFVPDPEGERDYYLVVSRFVPYKRVELAVEAFASRPDALLVVGGGPENAKLRAMATPNVEFIGKVTDKELSLLYQNAKALIFPGIEDFGLTPVEAQACGRPVVARGKGGATETVIDGVTGVFFEDDCADDLNEAISRLSKLEVDSKACRESALRFNEERFLEEIMSTLKPFLEKKSGSFISGGANNELS